MVISVDFRKKWTTNEQIYFLEKLGEFLRKGYTLTSAMNLLQFQKSKIRRQQLNNCLEKLQNGMAFYQVLEDFNFPKEVLSYLYFAEKHGDLDFALTQAGRFLKKNDQVTRKVQGLLKYPLFLIVTVIGLLIFVQQFLLPQFMQLYASMDIELSVFMQALLVLPQHLFLTTFLIACVATLLLIIHLYMTRRFSATRRMRLLLNIPYIKHLLLLRNTKYLSLQLSSLLKGGLPIIDALAVFEEQDHLPLFKEEGKLMRHLLGEGESFAQIVNISPFYEPDLPLIITHAEANGTLAVELEDYSEMLMERLAERLNKLTAVLQPIILVAIGGFVIALYLSIMLPMFKMIDGI